jgi:hypothetical protein
MMEDSRRPRTPPLSESPPGSFVAIEEPSFILVHSLVEVGELSSPAGAVDLFPVINWLRISILCLPNE